MFRKFKKCFIFLSLIVLPLAASPQDPLPQPAHKPPILTTTAIIEIHEGGDFKGIVLIERGKAPFGKAIPGGKVEYGETVENAVRREMKEEVNLDLTDLRQFHVYSDPTRDFRHHSVEVAHLAVAYQFPTAGDDAAKAFVVKLEDIPWDELAFDHAQVLKDYLEYRSGNQSVSMAKP
ncbi:MAG: NUDIX hydrolase [Verrucomicrobia bacterium]|nr:NUDIX hydrolase [Verrucomicrobiota bacterium]